MHNLSPEKKGRGSHTSMEPHFATIRMYPLSLHWEVIITARFHYLKTGSIFFHPNFFLGGSHKFAHLVAIWTYTVVYTEKCHNSLNLINTPSPRFQCVRVSRLTLKHRTCGTTANSYHTRPHPDQTCKGTRRSHNQIHCGHARGRDWAPRPHIAGSDS